MSDAFASQFRFSPITRLCVGVEEEVWTIRESGALTPLAPQIFQPGYERTYPFLKPELPSQQIEAVTPICTSMKEVEQSLRRNAFEMDRLAKQYGVLLSREPVPTKPYAVSYFRSPRFAELQKRLGTRLRGAYVAGLHVHIGVGNKEEAVLAMNVLRQHLPSFLALSARSPRKLASTQYASFRHFKYLQMAKNVAPPYLPSWKEFVIMARREGFHEDPRLCWWGVRINPLGTVELRVCDVQNTYSKTLALVGLTRMLVRAAIEGQVQPDQRITAFAIEDWLMMAARGIWKTTMLASTFAALAKDARHSEEVSYVKRLLP